MKNSKKKLTVTSIEFEKIPNEQLSDIKGGDCTCAYDTYHEPEICTDCEDVSFMQQ